MVRRAAAPPFVVGQQASPAEFTIVPLSTETAIDYFFI